MERAPRRRDALRRALATEVRLSSVETARSSRWLGRTELGVQNSLFRTSSPTHALAAGRDVASQCVLELVEGDAHCLAKGDCEGTLSDEASEEKVDSVLPIARQQEAESCVCGVVEGLRVRTHERL